MPHTIKKLTHDNTKVEVDPPLNGRSVIDREKFGVTDPAIGLEPGNVVEKGIPSIYVSRYAPTLAADLGAVPNVDRNPYNFVALAGEKPWRFRADPAGTVENSQFGHDQFRELTGIITFSAKTLSPCFVPEGFPVCVGDPKSGSGKYSEDDLRGQTRRFCRMHDHTGTEKYAIPGASFKGALRSAVEAIANSRFGVAEASRNHVFRRRVFQAGRLTAPRADGGWDVEAIQFNPFGGGELNLLNRMGLLAARARSKPEYKGADRMYKTYELPGRLAGEYMEQAKHPHFKEHWKNNAGYYDGLTDGNYDAALQSLGAGDVIYFTTGERSVVITNFGKNVNYLWPARKGLAEMAKEFLPRQRDAKDREKAGARLDNQLDMAENLFGFADEHDTEHHEVPLSHPFRGHVRVETLWGEEISKGKTEKLTLAALTAPASKGKSRPLYLAPGPDGQSGSFDDPKASIRGRTFYWNQRYDDGKQLWGKHTFAGAAGSADKELRKAIEKQCPAPIEAMPAGETFAGRIHFTNLPAHALGALLFALQGDGTFEHAFRMGKGKPRGMGSFQLRVSSIEAWRVADRYASLTEEKGKVELEGKKDAIVGAFRLWCAQQTKQPATMALASLPHIADYIKLHTWPKGNSVRSYPINFNQ